MCSSLLVTSNGSGNRGQEAGAKDAGQVGQQAAPFPIGQQRQQHRQLGCRKRAKLGNQVPVHTAVCLVVVCRFLHMHTMQSCPELCLFSNPVTKVSAKVIRF